jgi:ABC-2 type transport system ATP-binding protein
VHGVDVWAEPARAKAMIGNLADGVRLFDRLTGEQLITYTAMMFSVPRERSRGA